ncbi:enoyl-CoA hydratase/isomerase family protein [Acidiferrimicrobium sp. IK]|uniref:enoyl-CoA hydratase-related protein n=1 Tax=Acidiferrimicrobium sp. IK TaxID=2871700 RepID=UPI0021CB8763|nr:enoyl-CoA hydratase-related protein [Acidiferrimicrobium sp. IK]MCU4183254.1 enoyl-CoA hydratase/isomerase family protein [Acidiferrimicrobium sp. IK]
MTAAASAVVTVDDTIATVTLNRPDRRNAIDVPMLEELLAGLERLADDATIRVVILTGAGAAFCVGGDVRAIADGEMARPARGRPAREWMRIDELLHGMPKATIAAINGACGGAGLSLAAACDLRYSAASAVMATAFLRVGVPGDHGGIWSVTRALGAAKARQLFLLGERLSAEDALRAGLVHGVWPEAELLAEVRSVAAVLASRPPAALVAMKANLNDAMELDLGAYLDRETARFEAVVGSEATRAAARAFLEK